MADHTNDIRNLRNELDNAASKFRKELEDGNKKLSSMSKNAEELGKKMQNVVDPAAYIDKALGAMSVKQAALTNQVGIYTRTMDNAANGVEFIEDQLQEMADLQAKSTAAANKNGVALTSIEQQRLATLLSQKTTLEAQQIEYAEIYEKAGKQYDKSKGQLNTLETQQKILGFIGAVWGTLISAAEGYDKLLSDNAKAQGRNKQEIDAQYTAIQKINKGLGASAISNQEILGSLSAVTKEYAAIGSLGIKVAESAAYISRATGLSNDESVKFLATMSEIGGTSLMAQTNMAGVAQLAADAAGVPLGAVLRDVANASSAVRTIFKGNTTELVKTAAEAKKLGTSLDAMAKSAEALLDFESSIGAELKVSALLGQSLNFNESRRLAFSGDLLGAEKALQLEIAKVGDLDKLNYNQRKALAQATGKDFSELQKIETQKKNLIEAERLFPEEAKKMKKAQEELNKLQKSGSEARKQELELIMRQKNAETEAALLQNAKTDALNAFGKAMMPIYELLTEIQIKWFKFIKLVGESGTFVSATVAVLGLVAAFYLLKFGASKVLEFLGNALAKSVESVGGGIGKGLTRMSAGIRSFGRAMGNFPMAAIGKLALIMGILTLSVIGIAYAFSMLKDVSGEQMQTFTIALLVLGAALIGFAALLMFPPLQIGFAILAAGMLAMSLAAVGFGYAMSMTGTTVTAIGAALTAAAPIFATMLGIFTALPAVVLSVAAALIGLALASPGLLGAALGIGAVGLALSGMVVSLALFPTNELTRIATQLVGLSAAASGIGVAAASLKQLSGIELPTIDIGGGLEAAALGIDAVGVAMVALGVTLASFPTSELTSITTQLVGLSAAASGIGVAVASLKQLSGIELPTIDIGGLAAVSLLGGGGKKEENSEIKAGLEALGAKFDALTNMMASGGIVVNLDGTKVNNALARSASTRGAYGQATIV